MYSTTVPTLWLPVLSIVRNASQHHSKILIKQSRMYAFWANKRTSGFVVCNRFKKVIERFNDQVNIYLFCILGRNISILTLTMSMICFFVCNCFHFRYLEEVSIVKLLTICLMRKHDPTNKRVWGNGRTRAWGILLFPSFEFFITSGNMRRYKCLAPSKFFLYLCHFIISHRACWPYLTKRESNTNMKLSSSAML